jgi:hypothetical protein
MKSFMSTFSTAHARRFQVSLMILAALIVAVVAVSLMRMPQFTIPTQPAASAVGQTLDWPYPGRPARGAALPVSPAAAVGQTLDWPYPGRPARVAPAAPAVRETLDWPYPGRPVRGR